MTHLARQLCRAGVRIMEVPVGCHPRSRTEGKKIGWRDARQFAATLLRWQVSPVPDLRSFAGPVRAPVSALAPAPGDGCR